MKSHIVYFNGNIIQVDGKDIDDVIKNFSIDIINNIDYIDSLADEWYDNNQGFADVNSATDAVVDYFQSIPLKAKNFKKLDNLAYLSKDTPSYRPFLIVNLPLPEKLFNKIELDLRDLFQDTYIRGK